MSNTTIENYSAAITSGNVAQIAALLNDSVIIMPPASNQPNEGKAKASNMLSTLAVAVKDLKSIRIYQSNENWFNVLFEGWIDETAVQFIDQVHIGGDDLVNHVDIFLRPASMATTLLEKVNAEVKRKASL